MAKSKILRNKVALRTAAKTSSNRLHIVPSISGWSVKKEGALRSSAIYKTKKEALNGASGIKSKSAIVVHRKDGTIERWIEKV